MPAEKRDPDVTPEGPSQTVTRKVAPLIPLAIALTFSAWNGAPAPARVDLRVPVATVTAGALTGVRCGGGTVDSPACPAPYPMLEKGHPVDWWFVFKLNASKFPGCGGGAIACPFGGTPQTYLAGQQFAFASSEAATLDAGGEECLGTSTGDPVGATFDQIYNGSFHYAVWNDQFYGDPESASCGGTGCDSPWGHSKGMIAWNDAGEGLVMQVSTPSWPGSGSARTPRTDGNTLGCVKDDDVKVSQHFFALRLTKADLLEVLDGLSNASVATDPNNPEIVSNGGPAEVQAKVAALGVKTTGAAVVRGTLSSGVEMIAKPSRLHVPPWQMVSAELGGAALRTATWWASPEIPSTTAETAIGCWDASLGKAGAVEIATSGTWNGKAIGLKGGISPDANHAKLGVSSGGTGQYAIFGDMNQQGTLSGKCESSQNGRGGLFFVMQNEQLATSLGALLAGGSAPVAP